MFYTDQEVKVLHSFHSQYPDQNPAICCQGCYKQVPADDVTYVPVAVDDETGMATDEDPYCAKCVKRMEDRLDSGPDPDPDRFAKQSELGLERMLLDS